MKVFGAQTFWGKEINFGINSVNLSEGKWEIIMIMVDWKERVLMDNP